MLIASDFIFGADSPIEAWGATPAQASDSAIRGTCNCRVTKSRTISKSFCRYASDTVRVKT